MGAAEFAKSATDSLDKITDILNVGRLIFYTSAGFLLTVPAAMSLRLLTHAALQPFWRQFTRDMIACGRHLGVWLIALVLGFLFAAFANAIAMGKLQTIPKRQPETDHYSYQYPRLYSGGVRPQGTTPKDYAAWLISEYYRYVEIVVFIPYAAVLSLPVYSLYSLLYLIKSAGKQSGFVLGAGHYAFAAWTFTSIWALMVFWPQFWLPRVVQPTYKDWVVARREGVQGLEDFIKNTETAPAPKEAAPSKA